MDAPVSANSPPSPPSTPEPRARASTPSRLATPQLALPSTPPSTPPAVESSSPILPAQVVEPAQPAALAPEVQARLTRQANESVTISKFASLVAVLNDYRNRYARADLQDDFRRRYERGEFTFASGPFNRPQHNTRAARQQLAEWVGGRGILSETVIKEELDRHGVLLRHTDGQHLVPVVQQAMRSAERNNRAIYIDCGLLRCGDDAFEAEYEERGWAAPGIRWGSFIPDLIAVKSRGSGRGYTFEVIEIKYSGGGSLTVYPRYKIQAVFYHLALVKILRHVPDLAPSDQVTIWHTSDHYSSRRFPTSFKLVDEQDDVEEALFVTLPTWLEAVRLEGVAPPAPVQSLATSATPFNLVARVCTSQKEHGVAQILSSFDPLFQVGRSQPSSPEIVQLMEQFRLL